MVLRKYKAQDSKIICSWIKDAKQLYQWSADRIGRFLRESLRIMSVHGIVMKPPVFNQQEKL